jgi:hypothetical protein
MGGRERERKKAKIVKKEGIESSLFLPECVLSVH